MEDKMNFFLFPKEVKQGERETYRTGEINRNI